MHSTTPVFSCACCGHCCTGKGGIVISPGEVQRLCDYLRLTVQEFTSTYTEQRNGKMHIRTDDTQCCVFFRQGCIVHEAKPNICRAWPFFRGNLIDAASLSFAKEFCPGIRANASPAEFLREGLQYLQDNQLVADSSAQQASALNIKDLFAVLKKIDKE